MHNPKKGAQYEQKRKRRKERKEAKERKEGKEKTIPGFISKPIISTACARVRAHTFAYAYTYARNDEEMLACAFCRRYSGFGAESRLLVKSGPKATIA